jgi:hypothetical protein
MIVVDLNRDGFPDIALIDNYNKKVRTFLGDANQTYARQFVKDYSKLGKIFIGAADFNGDKIPDLAVDSVCSKTYFAIFPGKGNGELLSPVKINSGKSEQNFQQARVLDFNKDGLPDIVGLQESNTGSLLAFRNLGKNKFAPTRIQDNADYDSLTVGDFDGDGLDDVVLGELLNTEMVYFFKSNGDGTFKLSKKTKVSRIGSFLTCGDLNGDRKLDLVGDGIRWNDAWSMIGKGDGRFIKKKMLGADASFGGGAVLIDITGDKKMDLVSGETGGIALFQGKGNGTFASLGRLASHLRFDRGSAVWVTDVNRDGKLDFVGAQWDQGTDWRTDSDDLSNIILFINGLAPNTLSISDLNTSRLTYAAAVIQMTGSVSFQDSGGDVRFAGATEITDNAYLEFKIELDFPSPLDDYTITCWASGTFLNKPGETSGTISFDLTIPSPVVSTATPTLTLEDFYLYDYNLLRSNALLSSGQAQERASADIRRYEGGSLSTIQDRGAIVSIVRVLRKPTVKK